MPMPLVGFDAVVVVVADEFAETIGPDDDEGVRSCKVERSHGQETERSVVDARTVVDSYDGDKRPSG